MKKIGILFLLLVFLAVACKKNTPENEVIFQDDYSTNKGWTTGSTPTNSCSFAYNNGKYQITLDTSGVMCWAYVPYGYTPYSGEINYTYSLKVDCSINLDDNSKIGYAGFIFNYIDNDNFSVTLISNSGTFEIGQRIGGNSYQIVYPTTSSAINMGSGSINTLEITQNKTTLELNINDKPIGTYQMGKVNSDIRIGLLVSSSEGTDFSKVVASFDNFVLTKIQ